MQSSFLYNFERYTSKQLYIICSGYKLNPLNPKFELCTTQVSKFQNQWVTPGCRFHKPGFAFPSSGYLMNSVHFSTAITAPQSHIQVNCTKILYLPSDYQTAQTWLKILMIFIHDNIKQLFASSLKLINRPAKLLTIIVRLLETHTYITPVHCHHSPYYYLM